MIRDIRPAALSLMVLLLCAICAVSVYAIHSIKLIALDVIVLSPPYIPPIDTPIRLAARLTLYTIYEQETPHTALYEPATTSGFNILNAVACRDNIPIAFYSFMSYRTITNRQSIQWRLQQTAMTAPSGIRIYDDLPMVAIGTGWEVWVGDKIRVEFDDGTILYAIVGDIKDDFHTDSTNRITIANGCVLEFVVCTDVLDSLVLRMGNVGFLGINGRVIEIIRKGE